MATLHVRVSASEYDTPYARARAARLTISDWMHTCLEVITSLNTSAGEPNAQTASHRIDRFAVSLRGMVGASEASNLDLAGC
jgi:hypothetical protein